MARGGMTGQGGPRNPNRVTSRPTAVPTSVPGHAPTNPRQTPFTGTHPDGTPGRPPAAPLLPRDPENVRR